MDSGSRSAQVFLQGGGEMGELSRNFNWDVTALGSITGWPQSLKTAVNIILSSGFPMLLWWGPELVQFYNDAFRPSLGTDGKHPSSLGQPAKGYWQENWHIIKPLIDRVMDNGESVFYEDLPIPNYRNGHIEEVYWTFSYSPVFNKSGDVAGVLMTCFETTDLVLSRLRLKDSETLFRTLVENTPDVIIRWDKNLRLIYANDAFELKTGISLINVLGKTITGLEEVGNLLMPSVRYLEEALSQTDDRESYIEFDAIEGKHYYHTKLITEFDSKGTVTGVLSITSDISTIRKNEEKLNLSFKAGNLGWWELELKTMQLYASDHCKANFGRSKDNPFTYENLFEAIHPDDREYQALAVQAAIANNSEYNIEYRVIWPDGSLHWLNIRGEVKNNSNGVPVSMIGFSSDITQSKLVELSLLESELRFRSLIEEAPVATCLFTGREMTIAIANDIMLGVWGKDRSIVGKPLGEAVPELIGQPFLAILDTVFTTGVAYSETAAKAELEVAGVLGTYYFNFTYKPMFDENGEVYGVMDMAVDVTEQVLIRQRIEESEGHLQAAVDLAELGTWSVDLVSGETHLSERHLMMFGLPGGATFEDALACVLNEEAPRVAKIFSEAQHRTSGGRFDAEFTIRDAVTGKLKIIHSIGQVLFDITGEAYYISGSAQDITIQRNLQIKLEAEVQDRTEELATAVEELRATNEDLEDSNDNLLRSNEQLSQYAYIASHDLQEPLRKIQVFSGILTEKKNMPEDNRPLVDKIRESSQRMSLLIKDLLDFSKLSRGLKNEPVDLNRVVKDVLNDFELVIEEKNAIIDVGMLPTVEGIGLQLNQLFFNLIHNALKFVTDGTIPKIEISSSIASNDMLIKFTGSEQTQSYYDIAVKDNGIGFDEKYSEQIFEIFKRLHGKDMYPGSGIGLALCRKIVLYHNGFLYPESKDGVGTTFHILLPLKQ